MPCWCDSPWVFFPAVHTRRSPRFLFGDPILKRSVRRAPRQRGSENTRDREDDCCMSGHSSMAHSKASAVSHGINIIMNISAFRTTERRNRRLCIDFLMKLTNEVIENYQGHVMHFRYHRITQMPGPDMQEHLK